MTCPIDRKIYADTERGTDSDLTTRQKYTCRHTERGTDSDLTRQKDISRHREVQTVTCPINRKIYTDRERGRDSEVTKRQKDICRQRDTHRQ